MPRRGIGLIELLGFGLGTVVCNESVCVPVANRMLRLERRHHLHVLLVLHGVKKLQPMADWLAVSLLIDGKYDAGLLAL